MKIVPRLNLPSHGSFRKDCPPASLVVVVDGELGAGAWVHTQGRGLLNNPSVLGSGLVNALQRE